MIWTDEKIEELKRLHAANWSASQVAAEFGCTRNSVIGKWRRLGLSKTVEQRRAPLPVVKRSQVEHGADSALARKLQAKREAKVVAAPVPVEVLQATFDRPGLLDLRAGQCRYPFGDSVPFTFCGERSTHGPYCSEHYKLCYQPKLKKAAA